jgi:Leucine-rich repeat (LRR) protein
MSLKERFIQCMQSGARDLDAGGFDLPMCPKTIEENEKLRTLVRLNLSFNKIVAFPDLRRLTALCILHLSSNRLSSVDTPSFAGLTKLRELTLNGNTIDALPDSIGHFTKLEKLDVSNNRMQRLPNEIGYLCSLVELRCSGITIHS